MPECIQIKTAMPLHSGGDRSPLLARSPGSGTLQGALMSHLLD